MEPNTVKRGPGRPRKNPLPVETATAAPVAVVETPTPAPKFTAPTLTPLDDAYWTAEMMEQYGGDLSAWDSWNPRSGKPFPKHTDYAPGVMGNFLPDLNPPGMIVYRHDPTLRFHHALWDDDGSAYSRQMFVTMTRKGYRPATSDEFVVHPDLRTVITPDDNKRLTFAASKASALVVMVQGEEAYRRDRKYQTAASDEIQKTAEEKAATLQREMHDGGLRGIQHSTMKVEDDWEAADEFKRR